VPAGNWWRSLAWCCKCAGTAGALCSARSGGSGSGRALCGSAVDCLPALPLCKCAALCHHAAHEVGHCAPPHVNALPCAIMQTPCPVPTCKRPALCQHANALPCANMQTPCPVRSCSRPALCHHASHEVIVLPQRQIVSDLMPSQCKPQKHPQKT